MTEPSIVLADEPTGNLDSQSGEEIMEILRKMNEENGNTIILITHDPEIAEMANRNIWLRDGLIVNGAS